MSDRSRELATALLLLSVACGGSTNSSADDEPRSRRSSTRPHDSQDDDEDAAGSDEGPAATAVCVPPKSAAPTEVVLVPGEVTLPTLPASIRGETTTGLETFHAKFALDRVAKLHLRASGDRFSDPTEKTSIAVFVRNGNVDVNDDLVRLSLQVTSPKGEDDSAWLFPGEYTLEVFRTTYASAKANTPELPHTFSIELAAEYPPEEDGKCELPADLFATDALPSAECGSWCAKIAACGSWCRAEYQGSTPEILAESRCGIPEGQCAASVRSYLACRIGGEFECVQLPGGGRGYSTSGVCAFDASLCDPPSPPAKSE